MDTGNTTASMHRTDAYRQATDAASAERREIQAEIVSLEARVASLQARDVWLETLVRTLRELLPASQEAPAAYTPIYSIVNPSPELHARAVVDAELGRAASGPN